MRFRLPAVVVGVAMLVSGCATFDTDRHLAEVSTLVTQRAGVTIASLGDPYNGVDADALVQQKLAQPLAPDDAVAIALVRSPGLRARLAQVGIAEADLVQAGRVANPSFSFSRKSNQHGITIERALTVSLASLITMPLARDVEGRRFEHAKLAAASEVVEHMIRTRQAWVRAVTAAQVAVYQEQVLRAAEASAELARRMESVGNFSALTRLREQVFYADAAAQLARARQLALAEREALARLMGIWGSALDFKLPDRLPDLPAEPRTVEDAERAAIETRLEVQMARRNAEALAKWLGLSKATRFVNVLSAGYENESETGEPRKDGYEISLELPIFDWGDARVARAEALYKQALARTAETAIVARSEVRENYGAYRTSYDLARHYRDEIVPLRKRIADENLLRYNGMLISIFELLADAREQIASVNGAIEALRDFWIADAALTMVLTGSSPGGGAAAAPSPARPVTAAPAGGH